MGSSVLFKKKHALIVTVFEKHIQINPALFLHVSSISSELFFLEIPYFSSVIKGRNQNLVLNRSSLTVNVVLICFKHMMEEHIFCLTRSNFVDFCRILRFPPAWIHNA